MTVSTAYAPLTYNWTTTDQVLSVTWPFFTGSLIVTEITSAGVETVKTLTTHYTVSGGTDANGLPATGSVTMVGAATSGSTLRVERSTPKTQSSSWTNGGGFQPKTLEGTLDKLLLIDQEDAAAAADLLDGITGDVMRLNSAGATDYWDAEDQIIRNVADGSADDDAVNVSQLNAAILGSYGDVVRSVATITALKAFNPDLTTRVFLTDANRAGLFVWRTGDYSTEVATDTQNGVYVKHDDTAATSGAWVRAHDDIINVQWFGAVGDGVTSDQTAFAGALATAFKNIYVPATGSSYILTSLSAVNKERLYGPGVVSVSGTITHIPTIPQNTSADLAQLSIIDLDWQPSQTGALIGSTKKCPIFIQTTRTGGYGAYGNIYVQGLVSDSVAATEFDVGVTAFMSAQNNGGGTIYGMWAAANSPSSALGHTYTAGWTIGLAVNSGNRWADFGEQTDIGGTRNSIGIQIGADVTPAADGGTAGFDGSFAIAINGSSQGYKWWCGIFHRTDTTPAGGRVRRTGGGSVVGNAPADLEIGTGHFVDGYDLSAATISGNAFSSPGFSVNGTGAISATGTSTFRNDTIGSHTLRLVAVEASASAAPSASFFRNSASPAANDQLGVIAFSGTDSGATELTYASMRATIVDPTDTTEDGALEWSTVVNGTLGVGMRLAQGLFHPSATGTDKGANTINFGTIYQNNVQVATRTGTETLTNKTLTSPTVGTSLLLNSGVVFNWDTGDITLTHAASVLTLAGGQLEIDASTLSAAGLRVFGDNATEPVLEMQNTGAAGRTWRVVSGLTGVDNSSFSIYDATATTTRLLIDLNGNIGIGTGSTAPGDRLDVQNNGNANNFRLARFKNTTNGTAAVAGIEISAGSPANGLLIYHRAASHSAGGSLAVISNATGGELHLSGANSATEGLRIDANHNVVAGTSAALATTATNGFLYVPTCAGTPTGTPTTKTGKVPIVVDTTNGVLDVYTGSAWRGIALQSGTFTPAFSATGCTFNYTNQLGRYTRVGDRIDFSIDIQLAGSGNTLAANPLSITGLPVAASSYMGYSFKVAWAAATNSFLEVQVSLAASGSTLTIEGLTAAGASSSVALNASGILSTTGGSRIRVSGHYFV